MELSIGGKVIKHEESSLCASNLIKQHIY